MNFKEFLLETSNLEIVGEYLNKQCSVRELCKKTGKSIGEIYRIIHSYGKPNRNKIKHHLVNSLHTSGIDPRQISNISGYSKRQVLNIIKNGHNN